LLWADEFAGAAGAAPDPASWNAVLGDGSAYGIPGWGNNELETYVADAAAMDGNGSLVITAAASASGVGATPKYTSARLTTQGKRAFVWSAQYPTVRIEARVKLPARSGSWPAVWMLPEPNAYGTWCTSGEIDIVEQANASAVYQGSLHYAGAGGCQTSTNTIALPGASAASDWHVFAVEWSSKQVRFFADGTMYNAVDQPVWSGSVAGAPGGPFDQPFHIILNLAVGGNYVGGQAVDLQPGGPPWQMMVDYVRVYGLSF
jgi:beta-glucanase (GH16 family)